VTEPTEHELLRKIGDIHVALFGMEGQPQMGAIPQMVSSIESHGKRIGALEKWRWGIAGAIGLAVFLIKIWAKL
jgi:hypothetical protein